MSNAITLVTKFRYIVEQANKLAIFMTIENRFGFLLKYNKSYYQYFVVKNDRIYVRCFDALLYERETPVKSDTAVTHLISLDTNSLDKTTYIFG